MRMENHLQQNVAQLFAKQGAVVIVDGLTGLVYFFNKIAAYAFMCLLPIPGAAVFAAQDFHDAEQIFKAITLFVFKIYHKFSSFSSQNRIFSAVFLFQP